MTCFPNITTLKRKSYKKTVNGFIPKTVLVPLKQDIGKDECRLLVEIGDSVKEGQLIASSSYKKDEVESYIYSPIPGKIVGVELCTTPDGRKSNAVRIKLEGSFSFLGKRLIKTELTGMTAESLVRSIENKGVLNTYVSNEPKLLSEDLKKCMTKTKKGRLLVVRLFDEDPERITDSLLTRMFFNDIYSGAQICAKSMDASGIVFVADRDFIKPEKIEQKYPVLFVTCDSRKYPSGLKNEIMHLVKSIVKDEIFGSISKKSLYTDASTMLELYRTETYSMPVIDRYILVSGDCIPASGIVKVAIGTSLMEIAEQFGGFIRNPESIIINGKVTGFFTGSLNAPVTKYVKSIYFQSKRYTVDQRQTDCIRCGNCRRACPVKLSPDVIYRHIVDRIEIDESYIKSTLLCDNCGLCNSFCPSRLPLGQIIYDFKKHIKNNAEIIKSDLISSEERTDFVNKIEDKE